MGENLIQRYYLEKSTLNAAASEAVAWVKETGGTIIANGKRTFENTFDLNTPKVYSNFVSECSRYGVGLETIRGSYSAKGKRLVCLYLIDNELTKVESYLNLIETPKLKEILLVVGNKDNVVSWIKHYHAKPLNCSTEDYNAQSSMSTYELPDDISDILEYLAAMASGYNNRMKWNEEAKLKSDLMKNRRAWLDIPVEAIRQKCSELGMTLADTNTIATLIEKAQAGKQLIPKESYKNFKFKH